MDVTWSTLLFAGKWLFIGIIYFVLLMVVVAVRREMRLQVTLEPAAPGATAGRLRVVRNGSDTGLRPGVILPLPNEATLGADRGNDLVLRDNFVSGRHARLNWDGAEWWVEDLGSRNGTFVNGQPMPPHRAQVIPFGATLLVGGIALELEE